MHDQPEPAQNLRASILAEKKVINTPERRPIIRPMIRASSWAEEVNFLAELERLRRPPRPTRWLVPSQPLRGIPATSKRSSPTHESEALVGTNSKSADSSPTLLRPLAGSSSSPYLAVWKEHLALAPARRSRIQLEPCAVGRRSRTSSTATDQENDAHSLRSEVIEYLSNLQWFAGLSRPITDAALARAATCRHRQSSVGNVGTCFHILLTGTIRIRTMPPE